MAADAEITVVVDVLSFTTTVTVALDAGTSVYPYPYRWHDGTAEQYARQHRAALAVGRSEARAGQISLSPATLRLSEPPARLVLPSPNGDDDRSPPRRARLPVPGGVPTQRCGCRPVDTARLAEATGTVAVLAAGERWPDGGLRPAVEDLWGAGAVITHLSDHGWSSSPEAAAARAAYEAVRGREHEALLACASGRELVQKGYEADVTIAAEMDASGVVPVLEDKRFTDASQLD